MAFEKLTFTKSWENAQDFPTYESSEAQVRADLQLLHNEARDGLNRLVDALNAPTAAGQLPFLPEQGMTAENIQAAILETYGAVQNAAAGQIVNGSVTKEKLDAQLLERIYGGRPWVSMDTPGAAQTPEAGFPVGQIWLRPTFTVENLAGTAWSASAGTMEAAEDGWKLTGDGTMAAASAGQSLAGLGTAGQRVFAVLRVPEADSQLTGLTLYLNGKACDLLTGGGVFEAALDSQGGLTVTVTAQWPAAALAVGSVTLTCWTVVNAAQIEARQEDCAPLTDWPGLLEALVPFEACRLGRETYIQTAPGQWAQIDQEVLPVERGGTGLNALGAEGSILQIQDGAPVWHQADQAVPILGALRAMTGSYTGTGAERTMTLPVTPLLLMIYPQDGANAAASFGTVEPCPILLGNGAVATEQYHGSVGSGATSAYTCSVALNGDTLAFTMRASSSITNASDKLGNRSGASYSWVAIY